MVTFVRHSTANNILGMTNGLWDYLFNNYTLLRWLNIFYITEVKSFYDELRQSLRKGNNLWPELVFLNMIAFPKWFILCRQRSAISDLTFNFIRFWFTNRTSCNLNILTSFSWVFGLTSLCLVLRFNYAPGV